MADVNFVTIDLSKKQVDTEHPYKNENNHKDYLRIFAPGGGVIFYPADSIKVNSRDDRKVYFTRPEGTELQINYSKRNENVPDDAPASEKYQTYQRTVKIEDLKEMYEEERRAYLEKIFIDVEISKKLTREFSSREGVPLVAVSVPVYDEEQKKDVFFQIVVSPKSIRETEHENVVRLSMFRKGSDGNDYVFNAEMSVLNEETGQYEKETKEMTSADIARCFNESKERFKGQNASQYSSLGDELRQNEATPQGGQEAPGFRNNVRRGGR